MSDWAKKVAGTYVPDEAANLASTLAWVTEECRQGRFAEAMRSFCGSQPEMLDYRLALVETVTKDCIQGRIPCRCFDHESNSTFPAEVRFKLNPHTEAFERTN